MTFFGMTYFIGSIGTLHVQSIFRACPRAPAARARWGRAPHSHASHAGCCVLVRVAGSQRTDSSRAHAVHAYLTAFGCFILILEGNR